MCAHIQGLVTKIFSSNEFMPNFIHGYNARDHRRKQITSAMGQALAMFRFRQVHFPCLYLCCNGLNFPTACLNWFHKSQLLPCSIQNLWSSFVYNRNENRFLQEVQNNISLQNTNLLAWCLLLSIRLRRWSLYLHSSTHSFIFYYSRNDINSLMQAPDAKSVKMWWVNFIVLNNDYEHH